MLMYTADDLVVVEGILKMRGIEQTAFVEDFVPSVKKRAGRSSPLRR